MFLKVFPRVADLIRAVEYRDEAIRAFAIRGEESAARIAVLEDERRGLSHDLLEVCEENEELRDRVKSLVKSKSENERRLTIIRDTAFGVLYEAGL